MIFLQPLGGNVLYKYHLEDSDLHIYVYALCTDHHYTSCRIVEYHISIQTVMQVVDLFFDQLLVVILFIEFSKYMIV